MSQFFILFCFMICLPAFATYETVAITHSKMFPRNSDANHWGSLEIVGNNLDRIQDGRVVEEAYVQYRIGEGDWITISPDRRNHLWAVSSSINWRRYEFGPVLSTSFELRACYDNTGCSVPYVVHLTPQFEKILLPASGVITPFGKTLTFRLANHQSGGIKFQIGKMLTWPGSSEIEYRGEVEIEPYGACPKSSGSRECEIIVPDSIINSPGTYYLTARSNWGQSINYLQFQTSSIMKVRTISPEIIRSQIQDVLVFSFAGSVTGPNNNVRITMNSPCANRRMQVQMGSEFAVIKVPPECMPQSGCGNMEFSVTTQEGEEIIKVPYNI